MAITLEQRRFTSKIEADFGALFPQENISEDVRRARCFTGLVLTTKSGAPYPDLLKFVVDGSGDLGLDGIYYNKATRVLYFVQTKLRTSAKGFTEEEANKLIRGVKKLLAGDLKGANKKIVDLNPEIQLALDDINTRVQLLIACSSDASLGDSVKDILKEFCEEVNDFDEVFSYKYLGLKEVYSPARLFNRNASVTATIVFDDFCRIKKPQDCLLGIVSGEQIAKIVETHGDRIFDQNVRLTLQSSEVNEGILDTSKKRPESFFYFNNGLTAICSNFKAPPNAAESKSFEASELSIVNGAQTAGMLARAKFEKADLSKLKIPFRLISLAEAPAGFDESVTRANNSQNSLSSLDFVSLDPRQELIRNELVSRGYNYNVKRGGLRNQNLETIEVRDAAVALACKRSVNLTAQAKRYVSGLWQDTESSAYQEIFPENISGDEVLTAWKLYNVCQKEISRHRVDFPETASVVTHGEKFIAHVAFRLDSKPGADLDKARLAKKAVKETVRSYKKRKLSNPAYDFRNVKLLNEMAAEILSK
ncbi:hypothetical protein LCGC14_2005110 [marine sediment metagenome]|uniref:Abortive phage infection protein C-terminal domain-containing protein n=1 Tax=marine sediment metagenome TaxID=412755 RepID=A0A0F9F238_9ZZZZ